MLRFVLSAVALAGALATTQPDFAATASDHARAVAAVTEQPAAPIPASSSSSDATAPAGFGWG
jgi:hypothetical protein